jgi:hypothetical protein
MSENRTLPAPTQEEWVSCLSALVGWIDREAETARGIRVVRAIALHDLGALRSGQDPLPSDPATICSYLQEDGDRITDTDPGNVVRNSKPESALDKRLHRIELAMRAIGLGWTPVLTRHSGGGRGNLTHYRLGFLPLLGEAPATEDTFSSSTLEVTYETRPAQPTLLLRWLFVPSGFPLSMTSWRGLSFLGLLLLATLAMVGIGALVWTSFRHSGPLQATDVLALLMGMGIAAAIWPTLRALTEAAEQRVVECPGMLLSMSELYGQIRCTRRREKRIPVGWLSLVRISTTCPRCGGTVELMPGRQDFPGRMVGRCRDAPSEHVFSFDPTTYTGTPLR